MYLDASQGMEVIGGFGGQPTGQSTLLSLRQNSLPLEAE